MRTFRSIVYLNVVLFFWVGAIWPLNAQPVYMELTMAGHKFNLGFSEFESLPGAQPAALASNLQEICKSDLLYSRLFNIVEKGPVVKGEAEARKWAEIGTDVVVAATVGLHDGAQAFELKARLFDSASGRLVAEVPASSGLDDPAPAAHHLADEIVRYFTGRAGVAHTKIVFVNDATGHKELYVMDYDGRNLRRLTNDRSIVLFPKFSPSGQKISFTSYVSGNPDLYVINADGTGRIKVSNQRGLNTTASWAPDGERLAVTLSVNGAPNIYLIDLAGRILGALTRTVGADTAPTFSPDGSKIAFTSDVPGYPQIYVMSADGTGLDRLTTGGHCDSPRWCPIGPWVAYVKGEGGPYDIYAIDAGSKEEKRLTFGDGDSENPAWSPNGAFILFTKIKGHKSDLTIMGADGSSPRSVGELKGSSFTPDWGP